MENDTCTALEAWSLYDRWRTDARVEFRAEDAHFGAAWRRIGHLIAELPNAWTDAYLSAFAATIDATVVTFDLRFPLLEGTRIETLS